MPLHSKLRGGSDDRSLRGFFTAAAFVSLIALIWSQFGGKVGNL